MKKNRSSFFSETADYTHYNQNMYNQSMPNQNMMNMQQGVYPPNMQAQSSFQVGQNPAMMPAVPNQGMPNQNQGIMQPSLNHQLPTSDIESRLAKLERQINRIEHRLNKLEQNTTLSTDDYESNVNNMYMV